MEGAGSSRSILGGNVISVMKKKKKIISLIDRPRV
jgi:hypothetical protein